ncbi:carbon-nitrogen hydrolase [Stutzerimonas urumqiensis]|uniref:carbon-nitrogen hydrolase n=1 Tax=Stutzerimonas urumqiensis TaxID=638269 RepID=UPI000EB3A74E|nr:carbon-nitrogen hydrolase [Stutzerimonas urumqiensis]
MRTLKTRTLKAVVLLLLAAIGLFVYLDWARERDDGPLLSDLRPAAVTQYGAPGPQGNLIGIETRLTPADYQSPARLALKFSTYLNQARAAGLLTPESVVVLPEHVGTGLFAVGEKPVVQQARTLRDAMQWMALSNPWRYLRALLANGGRDRRTEAVLRMKADRMADHYQQVFGGLARAYGVTLVAGSIVLPEPRLEQGELVPGEGPLRQVSVVFGPDGQPLPPLWTKSRLDRYERRYSSPGAGEPPSPTRTPAGRLVVRLGCDSRLPINPTAQLLALPGASAPGRQCPETMGEPTVPRMAVRTQGLPWNLLGSPKRPAATPANDTARIKVQWLPAP